MPGTRREYDYTAAGFARYAAVTEERAGNRSEARIWRTVSWQLWDRSSSLRVDPDAQAYLDYGGAWYAAANEHARLSLGAGRGKRSR